jgi:photosystem II stability/assembly factor-like uncharacterized protein
MRLRIGAGVIVLSLAAAAQVNSSLYSGMRWRLVGPFRAGRVSAVAGVPGDPAVYYIGNPGGGVFKSTSGGEVWTPIFDREPVSSIGAIAVAPSNPAIVYVGTGDVDNVGGSVNEGDGVYRSTDAGRTWRHLGLDDTHHIGAVWVDPHNPDIVLVAALGHTYAANPERGVYRSTDGGRTWSKVLYEGPSVGAISLAADPGNPRELFAGLEWHAPLPGGRGRDRGGFGRGRGAPQPPLPGTGIYKSTDEGATWTPVRGHGLPEVSLGRIGLAVAAHTGGRRVYAITTAGLYRSDDAGASWRRMAANDRRIMGSGYFSEVYVSPANPDVVYVMQTCAYRSTDGGATFVAWKGAPGGDDYHEMWIDPTDPQRMVLGVDQGATISLNGGRQWSLGWYNLPNGQFYHIAVDNRSPYWIYGTQQDSGSAAVASFGDFGELTFMDWRPSVGAYEFGYIHPDLANPNYVYASGAGPALNRYNWTTKQILDITPPPSGHWRYAGSPQAESPQHPRTFYLGAQSVLATRDRGRAWRAVSPDLTAGGRAAITALAASAARDGELWAGTSDGRVQMTPGGGAPWKLVTPPGLPPRTPIEMIAASPLAAGTAFVVVERHLENDFRPYIFRTTDAGATWRRADAGIPAGDLVRVVRADPRKAGLLYAGTETGAYVSFDNGDRWQPLQLNLPVTSVRDLRVHGDDLVAGTYGRGIWILDDLTPLRQLTPGEAPAAPVLFRPETALRRQPDVNYDTPFPPEMPAGQNPPAGAVIDYYLPAAAHSVSLGIYDADGKLVRRLSSAPTPPAPAPQLEIPNAWLARRHPLPTAAGMHRVVWDLRYATPPSLFPQQPIAALWHATPTDPRGPFVTPGDYELRLTVDGHTLRAPLRVAMDSRIRTSAAGLTAQRDLALAIARALRASTAAAAHASGAAHLALLRANFGLSNLIALVELSDDAPTAAMRQTFAALCGQVAAHEPAGMAALPCRP